MRDFIHLSDIEKAIEVIIESKKIFEKNIFNLASGQTFTILEIAEKIAKHFRNEYDKKIEIIRNKVSQKIFKKYKIEIKELKMLGYNPSTSLKTGLNELIDCLLIKKNEKFL